MITFVGMAGRSSGQIRGFQIASAVDGNFYDFETGQLYCTNENDKLNNTIVFIRSFKENLAAQFKSDGAKIVFDVLDAPVARIEQVRLQENNFVDDFDWRDLTSDLIDEYIVNNSLVKNKLIDVGIDSNKIHIIAHHLAYAQPIKKSFKDKIETIGYVGLKDQFLLHEEMIEFCKKRNINFISAHPETREDCCKILESIDVGVVFYHYDSPEFSHALSYKPFTKLSNFQGFCVPSVVTEYESFKEFGKNAYLPGNNTVDFFNNLDVLIEDTELRKRIVDSGYKNAFDYSLEETIKKYKKIIK